MRVVQREAFYDEQQFFPVLIIGILKPSVKVLEILTNGAPKLCTGQSDCFAKGNKWRRL